MYGSQVTTILMLGIISTDPEHKPQMACYNTRTYYMLNDDIFQDHWRVGMMCIWVELVVLEKAHFHQLIRKEQMQTLPIEIALPQ